MKPLQPIPQQPDRRDVETLQTAEDKKLVRFDVGIIAGTATLSLAGLMVLAYYWISASSVAIPFVVGAALPLFTLFAVIYQAVVYHRQWNAMKHALKQTDRVIEKMDGQLMAMTEQLEIERAKTEPRLQITNVRVVNLRPDEAPIFMISIKNVGATDAVGVLIDLRVSFGKPIESTQAQNLREPQNVTIPAGQEHTYAIPWDGPVNEEHIRRLHRVALTVSGFIQPKGESKKEFCYRYYAIKGERPVGVPEFVPCDFDTRLRKVVTPGAAGIKVTAQAPIVTRGEVVPPKTEDKDDSNN